MFAPSLLSALLLALTTVSAIPVATVVDKHLVTLPISRHVNATSLRGLYQHDLKRAHALKACGKASSERAELVGTPATNQAVNYIAEVKVGSPPTTYNLLIDTGSSNTWIGVNRNYVPTSTSVDTRARVSVSYGSGAFQGEQYEDRLGLGDPRLVIAKQSIGVAISSEGFQSVDGILGLGPTNLTIGTLSPDTGTPIPTVTDNLFRAGQIPSNRIAISFAPTTVGSTANGAITWGGVDRSKFTGNITYVPITKVYPAGQYWGITQTIKYGNSPSPILDDAAGVVDTGTTLLLLAAPAYNTYASLTDARPDKATGLLTVTPAKFRELQSLFFIIGGTKFEFTPNAQIWPRSLNTAIGGKVGSIYLIVGNLGDIPGLGLDFINGQTWLERFYSVYDTTNRRVGIANTHFTHATTN